MVRLYNSNMDNKPIPELTLEYIKQFVRDTEEDIVYNPNKPETRNFDNVLFYYTDSNNNIIYGYNRKMLRDNINSYEHKRHWGCLTFFCNTDDKFKMPLCTNKAHINLISKTWYDKGEPVNYNVC